MPPEPELVANEDLQNLLGDAVHVCGRVGVTTLQQRLLIMVITGYECEISRKCYTNADDYHIKIPEDSLATTSTPL